MQTLNLLDSQFSEFNAYRVFDTHHVNTNKHGLALLEQLQTTLELDAMLSKFAMEASKYVDFSGLYFESKITSAAIRGSRKGKIERRFTLIVAGDVLGELVYAMNSPLSSTNVNILRELHAYLVHPIKNALAYKQALLLAMQDSLTGLGNRRYFDEQVNRAMHQAKRSHASVGIIVADLNKFKAINDTFGHAVGDKVLQHFADALRVSVRDSDSLFRFGGDEFVVLIEAADEQSLNVIYQRINDAVSLDAYLAKYQVSCSLGATFMLKDDTVHSFFERADKDLYRQKTRIAKNINIV